jgi:hypothetical protein
MPLQNVNLTVNLPWTQSATIAGGFQPVTQGPDSQNFSLFNINVATYNQLYTASYTLAASATQTIDLTSLTNLVGESIDYTQALSILVLPVGSQCTLKPGATNPLTWFFGGSTQSIIIPDSGMFAFSCPATGSGATVSGTAKTLELINSGATSLVVDITIIGAS